MIYSKFILLAALFFTTFINPNVQTDAVSNGGCASKDYSDCAAILFNGDVLVDEFSPSGRCTIEEKKTGKLNIATVDILTETLMIPKRLLKFHVAIKNMETNTLVLLTTEAVLEIELEDVRKQCSKGDLIIILTDDKKYSLTHHEIEIIKGC